MQHSGSVQLKIIIPCKVNDFPFIRFGMVLCRFLREEVIPEKIILIIILMEGGRLVRVFLMIGMVANNNFPLKGK